MAIGVARRGGRRSGERALRIPPSCSDPVSHACGPHVASFVRRSSVRDGLANVRACGRAWRAAQCALPKRFPVARGGSATKLVTGPLGRSGPQVLCRGVGNGLLDVPLFLIRRASFKCAGRRARLARAGVVSSGFVAPLGGLVARALGFQAPPWYGGRENEERALSGASASAPAASNRKMSSPQGPNAVVSHRSTCWAGTCLTTLSFKLSLAAALGFGSGRALATGTTHGARADHNQRSSTARSREKARVFRHLPRDRQPAQWRSLVGHSKASCALEVTARTSHYGLAAKKRGLPPVQCPSIARMLIAASAAQRARARGKLPCFPPCFATSRDTASAVAFARRACESQLCAGGHSSHVALHYFTEEERPPAGAVSVHIA